MSEEAELENDRGQSWREGPGDTGRSHRYSIFEHEALSFDQLQSALDAIPAYAWYAMPSGALTFVNRYKADYLGLPKDHPLRRGIDTGAAWDSYIALVHPEDHDESRRAWANCLRTGAAGELTFRLRNAQGGYRWFVGRAEPLRAEDGTLLCWIGVSFDIERRKQAEFYLLEAQRLARTGGWALNDAGFEYWSAQLFEIYGLKPGKPPSIPEYMELVHPEDRGLVAEEIRMAMSERHDFDFTKRIVRPDGDIRYVRCVGVATCDGILGTGIDVTEQEQSTRALRKSQDVLRQILDVTPQVVAVFGPARERFYANQTALDYIGLSLEEWLKGPTGHATIHPDDFERLQSRWDCASLDGSAFEMEVRVRRHDGIYRWFLARYNPVYEDEGKILRWYSACTDIEDRKRDEERLQRENIVLREQISQAAMFEDIVGTSAPLQKVLSQVSKVALSDSTVLVLGETGTGKELIARAIHERSRRAARAFIGVNCAAIPASLIASELFGHEKGAFTGAAQRRLGRFEAAHGGTIFLDEVGDLPMDTQITLLRVLQEREIERIGRDKPIPVDVRVIAATHRDLNRLVSEGKFRQDLFYRLNVVPITMPTLRERRADIPLLVEYFIARFGRKVGKKFRNVDKSTLEALKAYEWPGNVRELQNVIERAVTLSDSDIFIVDDAWLKREPSETSQPSTALADEILAHEKEAIEAALAQSQGRVGGPTGAAATLCLPTSTLDSKIKRLGIDKYRFRSKPG
ncbi:MAG TPA: sigma 54-interacting transcriptional regulator [Rhizomicrobium sp.]